MSNHAKQNELSQEIAPELAQELAQQLPKKFSKQHQAYVHTIKRRNFCISAMRYVLLIGFLALWEILAQCNILDPFIFSSPSRIFSTIVQLSQTGNLLTHIGVTSFEAIAGFVLSTLLGTLFAILLWWFPFAAKTLDPYLVILNAVPKIALGPILIVWLGAGIGAIVMIAVLVSIFVTVSSVLSGFMGLTENKLLLMRSLGASRLQMLTMVVLPSSLPTIIAALKLNVGMAWVGVIVGEFLVSRAGLGYLTVYGGQVFKLDIVMSSVVILCVLAAMMYYCVAWFEKKLTK